MASGELQTYYHIENWKAISARRIYGGALYGICSLLCSPPSEGDRPGINDKGLVTFDRKVRKDAFYFYKANWNHEEPMIYLASKRNIHRTKRIQTIQAFTNRPGAELFVNGKSYGKVTTDNYAVAEWKDVELQQGKNDIRVISTDKKGAVSDSFCCTLDPLP